MARAKQQTHSSEVARVHLLQRPAAFPGAHTGGLSGGRISGRAGHPPAMVGLRERRRCVDRARWRSRFHDASGSPKPHHRTLRLSYSARSTARPRSRHRELRGRHFDGAQQAASALLAAMEALARDRDCACLAISLLDRKVRRSSNLHRSQTGRLFKGAGFRLDVARLSKCFDPAATRQLETTGPSEPSKSTQVKL